GFVMSLFGNNTESARRNYIQLVYRYNTEKYKNELEFKNEGTEYRSGRTILVRDISPDSITMFIAKKFNISDIEIRIKNSKENMDAKSMLVVLMRCLCNYKCTDISRIIGNITESSISMLSSRGIGLISKRKEFKDIIREFISEYAA
ncbi:MAG: transposase, partial [Clostridiales bacterium]|nr:transposase [Clostridiales bacterium]